MTAAAMMIAGDPDADDGHAASLSRHAMAAEAHERAALLDSFGKGDVLIGAAAVSAGMADGIGTFESVLASLQNSTDPLAAIRRSAGAVRPVATSLLPVVKAAPRQPVHSEEDIRRIEAEFQRLAGERAAAAILEAHRMAIG